MLVHFVPVKYRGPSDFPIQMYLIKYKRYQTCILLKSVKYGNNRKIYFSSDCLNINAMFCFCLAGFT